LFKKNICMMIAVTIVASPMLPSQEVMGINTYGIKHSMQTPDYVKTKEIKAQEWEYKRLKTMGREMKDHKIVKTLKSIYFGQIPFSSMDLYKDGKLHIRRYYDWKGRADEEIEYTYLKTPGKDVVAMVRYRWTRSHWDHPTDRVPL
jgi:hypothetical protein